ncbi:MAG TPA: metalloregulator ArsR/SmtB family transcription factor [Alphaproteobacteria bacterium]|nr:metalloregulator ArsR/SmtB family transcription factor [Alphaproteobacteria bacterium]
MAQALTLRAVTLGQEADRQEQALDMAFGALSDPVRRRILIELDGHDLLVSEIAAHFEITLQAVSRHIQVLVRAGLVRQERTGRISRCSLVTGPIYDAAVWLNRYSKYWKDQFDLLALTLDDLEREKVARLRKGRRRNTRRLKSRV